jgi:hypothetical protein
MALRNGAYGLASSVAVVMAALVLVFCFAAATHADAAGTACTGRDLSPKVCGQPSTPDPAPAVLQPTPSLHSDGAVAGWMILPPTVGEASQAHADPSAPRAPPLSLG